MVIFHFNGCFRDNFKQQQPMFGRDSPNGFPGQNHPKDRSWCIPKMVLNVAMRKKGSLATKLDAHPSSSYIYKWLYGYIFIHIYIYVYIYSHIAIVLGVVCQLVGLQIPCLQPMYYHCNCTRPRWIFACGMTSMALTCGPEAVTNDFQMENGHLWLIYLVKMVIFPRKLLVYQKVTQDSECK